MVLLPPSSICIQLNSFHLPTPRKGGQRTWRMEGNSRLPQEISTAAVGPCPGPGQPGEGLLMKGAVPLASEKLAWVSPHGFQLWAILGISQLEKMVRGPLCLLPHRQVYGLHAGTTYAHTTLLTLGSTHSKDALQSHVNKAHLGWGGRERGKKGEGTVPTEASKLWSTYSSSSEVALSTHRCRVSEAKRSSGFTLTFSCSLRGLSSFLLAELPASSSKILGLNSTWQMSQGIACMLCKPLLVFWPDPSLTDQEDADTPNGCNFGGPAPALGGTWAMTGRQSHCQSMGRAALWGR